LTKLVIANNGTIDGTENIKLDNLIKDNKGMALLPRPVIPDIEQLKKDHQLDGITFQWETVLKGVSPALYDNYLKRKGKFNKPSGSNLQTTSVTPTGVLSEVEEKHAEEVNPNNVELQINNKNASNAASSQSVSANSGVGTGILNGGKRRHKTTKGKSRRNQTHRVHYRRHHISSTKKNKRNNRTHRK
jgi:hypothetical protein